MKTIIQYPMDGKDLAIMDALREQVFNLTTKITESYNKVPSVEIWSDDSLNATIRQIDYYRQSKIFPSDEYAISVYRNLHDMIDHVEKQTEAGYKFAKNSKPTSTSSSYKFYRNEFVLGDNCNLAILNDTKVVYINHSVLNILMTKDPVFTEYIYQHTQNVIRRSTLMSYVGEKERRRFFTDLHQKIDVAMKSH